MKVRDQNPLSRQPDLQIGINVQKQEFNTALRSSKSRQPSAPLRETSANIESLVKVRISALVDELPGEHIRLHHDRDGVLLGISWPFKTEDAGLRSLVKRHGGRWQAGSRWSFEDDKKLHAFLTLLKKRNGKWPVVNNTLADSMKAVQFERLIDVSRVNVALIVKLPLPFLVSINVPAGVQIYKLTSEQKSIAVFVGEPEFLDEVARSLAGQGAVASESLVQQWGISVDPHPVRVTSKGWCVQIECDLSNLDHFMLAPNQTFKWDAPYPRGTKKTPVAWTGLINVTRKS